MSEHLQRAKDTLSQVKSGHVTPEQEMLVLMRVQALALLSIAETLERVNTKTEDL